jgi:diamine N-acetyltransferase
VKRRLRKMLKGEKVVLRPYSRDDVSCMTKWLNDPDTIKYIASRCMYGAFRESMEEAYDTLKKFSNSKIFIIETLDNKVIGMINLNTISWEWRNSEIGVLIGEKDNWGKGYATDAMRVLLVFGFNRLNLHRIYLHVSEANVGAIRCYEKLGFKKEAILREAEYRCGKYENAVLMGILQEEFKQILKTGGCNNA